MTVKLVAGKAYITMNLGAIRGVCEREPEEKMHRQRPVVAQIQIDCY